MTNGNGKKSETVSQSEINGILWKACDTFRGAVDPSEYKNYILVMLFVKYISDVWQDHYAKFVEEYGDPKSKTAEERIQRRLKRERFVLPAHCTFDVLYEQRSASNIGEVINTVLDEIEDSNKEKLEGVFRNIDFNSEASLGQTKERNIRLKSLLEDFSNPRLDLRPSRVGTLDVIGNAYEYLIGKFAANAGKKAGEFYTPPEVSQLIARLVDPQPGERICDPACGSGSLLIKCGQQVGTKDFSLWGQENIGATWALSKMNMFLHGMDNARIEWGDTIRNPKLLSDDRLMKFEVVVANPPFSLDKWGQDEAKADHYNRFHRGVPAKNRGDFAFISHMIETITETSGRVGVVAPHGVLFRGGGEGKIRSSLLKENLLDAVIGLPPNLFYGTEIEATILIFKKGKSDKTVWFMDAKHGFESAPNQNRLRAQDVESILNAYHQRTTSEHSTYVAQFSQIKKKEFNLNIPLYVDTFRENETVEIALVQERLKAIDKSIAKASTEMDQHVAAAMTLNQIPEEATESIGDNLVSIESFMTPTSHPVPRPDTPYTALSVRSHCKGTFQREVEDPTSVAMDTLYEVKPLEVIVNITFAWEGAIGFVKPEDRGCLVSHRFPTYRVDQEQVDIDFVRYLVTTKWFIHQLGLISPGGAGRNKVMSKKDFLKLRVHLPPLDEQRQVGKILAASDRNLELCSERLAALQERKAGLLQRLVAGRKR